MKKQELFDRVTAYFQEAMPVAETELHYETPFQLLVAVILSAQCTDKRVNMVTPALFHDYPTPEALAASTPDVIFEYVRTVSYPNNKAKHLVGMAQMLMKDFNGEVPDNLEDLVKLPGVGRKTANVIQAVIWGKDAMPVDTHVFRVSHRIGLVASRHTTPLSVEKELTKYFPAGLIATAHHWLILHGRYTCTALRPKCDSCGLCLLCKHYKKTSSMREAKQKMLK
ncbi:MAG: endonuclease III [Bacteroidaceae bacterium]|nr:endonuclease III [Bacteroidaceae bacterium]